MIARTLSVAVLALACGCSTPDPARTTPIPAPLAPEVFRPVAAALGASCASLDCHGQTGRNLRLYDAFGLRLSSADVPGKGATTDAEILADERSLLGLEPDVIAAVIHDKGADPMRLSIVRKARGAEVHKGSVVWPAGSPGDGCLLSWLASSIDTAACGCVIAVDCPAK